MSAPLPPAAALAHAARLLAGHGFPEVARNERGDSLYLRPEGCAFCLRLSNHPRTARQRQRRTDVLASLVVRGPTSTDRITAMVAAALRDFALSRARRETQPSEATSRK